MWLLTPQGFFSIVEKPDDAARGSLTVRARVRSDLDSLRAAVLPELETIEESENTDYRYRARAPRAAVAAAMARLAETLDYSNFKSVVARRQGATRAKLYHDVWDVLYRMQGNPAFQAPGARSRQPLAVAQATAVIPRADAYGGVLVDAKGRVLLRAPKGHYGGYVWTFPKGPIPRLDHRQWKPQGAQIRQPSQEKETGNDRRAQLRGRPGGSTGTSRPRRCVSRKGAPRRARGPPVDYRDGSCRA